MTYGTSVFGGQNANQEGAVSGVQSPLVIAMEAMFDIFTTLPDGSPLWLEAVEGLNQARERLTGLMQARPGAYFIYSEKTGGVVERVPRDSDGPPNQKATRQATDCHS